MENFNTLKMNVNGVPKNHLSASYMAHYPDDNTTELDYPVLEIFRENKLPINVSADKGWVTSSNEVILLTDKHATLINKNSITNSEGIRIYLQEQRMEFLNNVQTTIEKNQKN